LFLSNLPFIDSYSGVEGRQIYIVNPDPKCKSNYQFVLSKGHAELLSQRFSMEHVNLMKAGLRNA